MVIQHRLSATPPASHIVSLPNTFKGLKVVQLVLSIAALGLSAYLLALTHLEGYAVAAVVAVCTHDLHADDPKYLMTRTL